MAEYLRSEGWDEVKVVSLFSTEPNHFHTKRPMKSVTDLAGMKIRIAGPVYGATVGLVFRYGAGESLLDTQRRYD